MDKIKFRSFLSVFTSLCIVGAVPIMTRYNKPDDKGAQAVTDENGASRDR